MTFIVDNEKCKRLCGYLLNINWEECSAAEELFYAIYSQNGRRYNEEDIEDGPPFTSEQEDEFITLLNSNRSVYDTRYHPVQDESWFDIRIDRIQDYINNGYQPSDDYYWLDDEYGDDDEEDGKTIGKEMLF